MPLSSRYNYRSPSYSSYGSASSGAAPAPNLGAETYPYPFPVGPNSSNNQSALFSPQGPNQSKYIGQLGTGVAELGGQFTSAGDWLAGLGGQDIGAYQKYLEALTSPDSAARMTANAPAIGDITSQYAGEKQQLADLPRGGAQDYLEAQGAQQEAGQIGNLLATTYTNAQNELGQLGLEGYTTGMNTVGQGINAAQTGADLTAESAGLTAGGKQANLGNIASLLGYGPGSSLLNSVLSPVASGIGKDLANALGLSSSTASTALPAAVDAIGNASAPLAMLPVDTSALGDISSLPGVASGLATSLPSIGGDLAAVGGDATAPIATLPLDTSDLAAVSALGQGTTTGATSGLSGALSSLGSDVSGAFGDVGGALSSAAGDVGSAFGAASGALSGIGADIGADLGSATLGTVLGAAGAALPFLAPLALIPLLFHGANPGQVPAAKASQVPEVTADDIYNAVKSGVLTPAQGAQAIQAVQSAGDTYVGNIVSGIKNPNSKILNSVPYMNNVLQNELTNVQGMPGTTLGHAATPADVSAALMSTSTPGWYSPSLSTGDQIAQQIINSYINGSTPQPAFS